MKMKNFQFSKYCTPAQLYLVIGVICIISGFFTNYSIETLLTQALFLVIWAWVLNWLCLKGFKAISWIIVLLPFIFFLFMYFLIKDVVVVKEGLIDCTGGNWAKYGTPGACARAQAIEAVMEAEKKRIKEQQDEMMRQQQASLEKMRQDAAAAAAAAEKKRQEEAAAAAEKKRQEEAAAAAAAAEKKRKEEAAAAAKAAACKACESETSAKNKNNCKKQNMC